MSNTVHSKATLQAKCTSSLEIICVAELYETRHEISPVIKEWASSRTLCQHNMVSDLSACCISVHGPWLAIVQVLLNHLKCFREYGKEGVSYRLHTLVQPRRVQRKYFCSTWHCRNSSSLVLLKHKR